MTQLIDLTGSVFGHLTVLHRDEALTGRRDGAHWVCSCVCGRSKTFRGANLTLGKTKSCGCRSKTTHGMSGKRKAAQRNISPEYMTWGNMHARCRPDGKQHWDYYDRGITVCPEWTGQGGFEAFFAYVGPRPEGTSLDRIDNDRGYEPGNVRWATQSVQQANRRKVSVLQLEINRLRALLDAADISY